MSRLAAFKATYPNDISLRVRSGFIILTESQNEYCWSKLLKKKKHTHTHTCDVNNRKVVITPLTLLLLNLMIMYIFSRIPGKHKSNLKFFKYIYTEKTQYRKLFTTVIAKISLKQYHDKINIIHSIEEIV